jgi:glutathione synthase/RimK-type ligase-like ATP-grasp enzyme
MILLCGIASESPLELVRRRLDERGVAYAMFNQRRFAEATIDLSIVTGEAGGRFRIGSDGYRLEEFVGVYTRLMDDQTLPELIGQPPQSAARRYSRALHATLMRWLEIAPARVVNRSGPQASNFSKPYQAQLIRACGFAIPRTLITNQPQLVRDFVADHGRVVYKSISGVRSIVKELDAARLANLEQIRWCPVQFQEYVPGMNVRVHTIGREVFATQISSEATDYRYAHHDALSAELRPISLSDELAERCLQLATTLRLPLAGIDLKLRPDGEAVCFEVNPSPAYSYYELDAGQPISAAIARYLADG